MKSGSTPPQDIDAYIATFPRAIQTLLKKMRATIQRAAPQATEKISYQIPTFFLQGNLVHFAAFKEHLSFFPTSSGIKVFHQELARYTGSKGTVRFPYGEPIPWPLISKIVKFRVQENLARAVQKVAQKKAANKNAAKKAPRK